MERVSAQADKPRLTASEREALLRMNIALEVLYTETKPLERRARLIPGAKRDLAMMAGKIRKLMQEFAKTIPDNQLLTYRRALEMVSYTVGVRQPGKDGQRSYREYGMWLPFEVLNELLVGCHDHCLVCHDDPAKRRACKLRKALETIPNDRDEREDGDCPYYTLM